MTGLDEAGAMIAKGFAADAVYPPASRVSDTPLLDQLDALGTAGVQLLGACEQIVDQARHELRNRDREQRHRNVARRVALFLADHPDASANEVHRAVGGTRGEVLTAVRAVRTASAAPLLPIRGRVWRRNPQ